MSLKQRVTLGILWLSGAQVARRLSGLLITALLARMLTPNDFGLFALATAFLGIFAIISDLGFSAALIQRTDVTAEHMATAFTASLVASTVVALAGLVISLWAGGYTTTAKAVPVFWVLLLNLPLSSFTQVPSALLSRRLAFRQLAMIELTVAFIAGMAGVGVAFIGGGAWALVVQSVSTILIRACATAVAAGWQPRLSFSMFHLRELSPFGLSVLSGALVNHFAGNIDYLIIGARLGTEALGFYTIAFTLALLPAGSISGVMATVMFPVLSSVKDEPFRLRSAYLRLVRTVSVCTPPIVVGLGIVSPILVPLIYGLKWAPSVPLVQLLVVVGMCQAINTAGLLLYSLGRPYCLLLLGSFHLLVMAVAMLFAVRWGAVPATAAYACISPFTFCITHFVANRLAAIPLLSYGRALAPGLAGCGLMWAICTLVMKMLPEYISSMIVILPIIVTVGATVYGAGLAVIGLMSGFSIQQLPRWASGEYLES